MQAEKKNLEHSEKKVIHPALMCRVEQGSRVSDDLARNRRLYHALVAGKNVREEIDRSILPLFSLDMPKRE